MPRRLLCTLVLLQFCAASASRAALAEDDRFQGKTAAEWQKRLDADDALDRQDAVKALGVLVATPQLVGALAHDDPVVRYWAAVELGQQTSPSKETLKSLRPLLDDDVPNVRIATAEAICRHADGHRQALDVLIAAMGHPHGAVRLAAITSLEAIGPRASPALDVITEAKDDSNDYVGRIATRILATLAAAAENPPRRPNILWISVEDISADLGCYGDEYAITPNIDRFAAEGVRYTHCFGHAGVCAVNRSGIITGMYPTSIGTQHMRCKGIPPADVKCFTEYLRAAGYYCTNNVKTDYNFDPPITAWDESSRTAHWRGREPGQPFFAVINLTTTHEGQIRLDDEAFARRTAALEPHERHDPAAAILPPYYPDTPIVRNDWARYHDLITAMDKQVGEILAELESDGLADETIVFFWSDHGRGLPRGKRWLYDSGLHVPLIVRTPDMLESGTTSDELVAFIDLAPTVLSLAGVPIPATFQGQAFLGPSKAPPREYVFAARDRMDETYEVIRAVRDKRFKYLRNYEPYKPYAQPITYGEQMPTMQELRRLHAAGQLTGPQELFFRSRKPVEELYDTEADPHELNNLAELPEYREVLQRLRAAHHRWRRETCDLGLVPEAMIWTERRPDDVWQVTGAPTFVIEGTSSDGRAIVTIHSTTEGASIAYTTDRGDTPHWRLCSGPIEIDAQAPLRATAVRLGYEQSPVVEFDRSQATASSR